MSLFDDVLQQVTGGMSSEHAQLANGVLDLIKEHPGGLSGLVQSFHDNGLGSIVSSWVSTGENLPITADQIQAALGNDKVQQFAAKAGITPDAAKATLAEVLPTLVNKLTPDGKVPESSGLLGAATSFLKGKASP
jgi:uncharacterized protein YidB (DUF937 family)